METPTIGRIVLVTLPSGPDLAGPFAAIVTAPPDSDGAIECTVFAPRSARVPSAQLGDVLPADAGPGGPRWHWPPRDGAPWDPFGAADPEPSPAAAPDASPGDRADGSRKRGPGGRFLPRG